jgi:hypothetical protein
MKMNVISYGSNHYSPKNKNSIHAEYDCIDKLPYYKRQKKLCNINILIIRVSKTNKLGMSKPCKQCVRDMNLLPKKKGYKIQYIYYSNEKEEIIKTTLNRLI